MAVPRALILASLAAFATDSSDCERLRHLSSREGRDDYRSFILDQKRCLGELLCFTFPSIRIPLNHLLNIIPPPHPREYTGANGGKSVRTEVHLAVSVLEKTLDGGREWKGLCSSFLANLKPGDQCRVIVRQSGFHLPSEPDRPVIMIGPGTGIAPMRALLQDLQQVINMYSFGFNVRLLLIEQFINPNTCGDLLGATLWVEENHMALLWMP